MLYGCAGVTGDTGATGATGPIGVTGATGAAGEFSQLWPEVWSNHRGPRPITNWLGLNQSIGMNCGCRPWSLQ